MAQEQHRRAGQQITRREALRVAGGGATALAAGGALTACGAGGQTQTTQARGPVRRGGTLRMGATGGSAKDTLDAHQPISDADIARTYQLYDGLSYTDLDAQNVLGLAESLEPEHGGASWTIRLKHGLEFHNGNDVTAEDVLFSFKRIVDPKSPKSAANALGELDLSAARKLDRLTLRVPMKHPLSNLIDRLANFASIVPVGYDPHRPVGTGAFKFKAFTAGQQSTFVRNQNYWRENEPHLDQVVIIDFADPTARANALFSGEVDCISNLPANQLAAVRSNPQLRVLDNETGSWQPFTMRVDQPPFDDVRVRQAFRLIVDRPQTIQQVLAGEGRVANDLYGRYDPAYDHALPQRHQDLEQARSLLRRAGHADLAVELVTAPVFQGLVEAAQVLAQQAKGAGVTVKVRKVDPGTFYGPNYLKWPFAQDYWYTNTFLGQTTLGSLPTSPFNETHWRDPQFARLVAEAGATFDKARRAELIHAAQRIEWNRGGYIIWGFSNQLDAASAKLRWFPPCKSGNPLSNYGFRAVGFAA